MSFRNEDNVFQGNAREKDQKAKEALKIHKQKSLEILSANGVKVEKFICINHIEVGRACENRKSNGDKGNERCKQF